jgi:hypothetical protein
VKDLLVLCADKKIEAAVVGLLSRPQALSIRPVDFETNVHPQHDPGCFHQAAAFLRPLRQSFRHALVVFDRAWEGAPLRSALELTETLQRALRANWGDAADVVVIDPELEAWVWSNSPHVESILGWQNRKPALRDWLDSRGLWGPEATKPEDPKAAVEHAVRESRKRWTAAACRQLSDNVSVVRCTDPSFQRLKDLLAGWFGPAPGP